MKSFKIQKYTGESNNRKLRVEEVKFTFDEALEVFNEWVSESNINEEDVTIRKEDNIAYTSLFNDTLITIN